MAVSGSGPPPGSAALFCAPVRSLGPQYYSALSRGATANFASFGGASTDQGMVSSRSRAMPMAAAAPSRTSGGVRSPTPSESTRSGGYGQYQNRGALFSATGGVSTESLSNSDDPLDQIISLQNFQGFWELEQALLDACGIKKRASATDSSQRIAATILAIKFLERKMAGEKDTWELIVEKAKGWLDSEGVKVEEEVEKEPLRGLISHL